MNSIFRKSSLEKLSSPEQLDRTIAITSPLSWMAIIGIAVITIAFIYWTIAGTLPTTVNSAGIIVNGQDVITIHSSYTGKLTESYIESGKQVNEGDIIGIVQDEYGSATELIATQSGRITNIPHKVGDSVKKYDVIAKLSQKTASENILVTYLPIDTGKLIQKGMRTIVTPASLDGQKYGHMEAEVISVDDYVTSNEDIQYIIGNNNALNNLFVSDTPMISVVFALKEDNETKSGYYWSSEKGKTLDVTAGTIAQIQIITSESAPIAKLLPIIDTEAE